MNEMVRRAEEVVTANPRWAGLAVQAAEGELHLKRGDALFARLIPGDGPDRWRLEYCRNKDSWECHQLQGTLEECLEFLKDDDHFQFWEG